MDIEPLLQAIREALTAIVDPRFYETERGFQGELLAELRMRIPALLPVDRAIVEQEHQKSLARHGVALRPDIIIHQPFNSAIHASRREGNFAVIALKLRAGPKKAAQDFGDLVTMLDVLRYPIGIFINIGHTRTQIGHAPVQAHGRVVAFATRLTAKGVGIVEACA